MASLTQLGRGILWFSHNPKLLRTPCPCIQINVLNEVSYRIKLQRRRMGTTSPGTKRQCITYDHSTPDRSDLYSPLPLEC